MKHRILMTITIVLALLVAAIPASAASTTWTSFYFTSYFRHPLTPHETRISGGGDFKNVIRLQRIK